MKMIRLLALGTICLCCSSVDAGITGHGPSIKITNPRFSNVYTITGILYMPYAEIKEPFQAWYDGKASKSRIDYYGGIMATYQRGDITPYGASWKTVPFTNDSVINLPMCFGVNGTENGTLTIQSVLPDLKDFKLVRYEIYGGKLCNVYQNISKGGNKTNKYTMWVTADDAQIPVRYELKGYDTLLGSHYDHYYFEYSNYKTDPINPLTFEINTGKYGTCRGFPGPGVDHVLTMNPMAEFVARSSAHTAHKAAFNDFKNKFNKKYDSDKHHLERSHIFKHNLRFIHSNNRAGKGFTMAVNHLADRTDQELKVLRGRTHSPNVRNQGLPFPKQQFPPVSDRPDSWDWRLYGAVTQVKDQAVCGSCWSFGTTGTIEGALFMLTGQLTRLSQQELMDCSWGEGNNACDGGEDFRAYDWIMKNGGITSEDQYGQYLAIDGYCRERQVKPVVTLKGYVNITEGDQAGLHLAIWKAGPVSVAIDASHKSLAFYSNGVYYEPACGNGPDDLDHAVLAVGFGEMNGQQYWLVKNSWSTYWGNAGYVLMSLKDNNCGVATSATYPIVKLP